MILTLPIPRMFFKPELIGLISQVWLSIKELNSYRFDINTANGFFFTPFIMAGWGGD